MSAPVAYTGRVVKRSIERDEVGWCHNCGTLQLFHDAPWLAVPFVYRDYVRVPCCSVCREAEPWELGVFPQKGASFVECAALGHVTWWDNDGCDECGASA